MVGPGGSTQQCDLHTEQLCAALEQVISLGYMKVLNTSGFTDTVVYHVTTFVRAEKCNENCVRKI